MVSDYCASATHLKRNGRVIQNLKFNTSFSFASAYENEVLSKKHNS